MSQAGMSEDRAERVMVAVSVVCFWATVLLLPVLLMWLWGSLAPSPDGSAKDPMLLVTLVAVPLAPCFAMIPVGLWHIRKFVDVHREFAGIDLLALLSVLCILTLFTAVADISGGDAMPFLAKD